MRRITKGFQGPGKSNPGTSNPKIRYRLWFFENFPGLQRRARAQ